MLEKITNPLISFFHSKIGENNPRFQSLYRICLIGGSVLFVGVILVPALIRIISKKKLGCNQCAEFEKTKENLKKMTDECLQNREKISNLETENNSLKSKISQLEAKNKESPSTTTFNKDQLAKVESDQIKTNLLRLMPQPMRELVMPYIDDTPYPISTDHSYIYESQLGTHFQDEKSDFKIRWGKRIHTGRYDAYFNYFIILPILRQGKTGLFVLEKAIKDNRWIANVFFYTDKTFVETTVWKHWKLSGMQHAFIHWECENGKDTLKNSFHKENQENNFITLTNLLKGSEATFQNFDKKLGDEKITFSLLKI